MHCKDYFHRSSYRNGCELFADQENVFLIREIDTHKSKSLRRIYIYIYKYITSVVTEVDFNIRQRLLYQSYNGVNLSIFRSNPSTYLICFWGYIFKQDQENWFDGHQHTPVLPVYKALYPKCSWTACRRDRVVFSSPIAIRRNWTYFTGSWTREFQC